MTRERAKELLKAIEWWSKGGDLWWYNHNIKQWRRYVGYDIDFNDLKPNEAIIEDKFFETRKAYALGKPIEYKNTYAGTNEWVEIKRPEWLDNVEYREIKPQWYEMKENIGKAIMVRDYDSQKWKPAVFTYYIKHLNYPFNGIWKQARLVIEDDLAKESQDE